MVVQVVHYTMTFNLKSKWGLKNTACTPLAKLCALVQASVHPKDAYFFSSVPKRD